VSVAIVCAGAWRGLSLRLVLLFVAGCLVVRSHSLFLGGFVMIQKRVDAVFAVQPCGLRAGVPVSPYWVVTVTTGEHRVILSDCDTEQEARYVEACLIAASAGR
jgi:hypothetical protein